MVDCFPLCIPLAFTTFDIHIHQSFASFPSLTSCSSFVYNGLYTHLWLVESNFLLYLLICLFRPTNLIVNLLKYGYTNNFNPINQTIVGIHSYDGWIEGSLRWWCCGYHGQGLVSNTHVLCLYGEWYACMITIYIPCCSFDHLLLRFEAIEWTIFPEKKSNNRWTQDIWVIAFVEVDWVVEIH